MTTATKAKLPKYFNDNYFSIGNSYVYATLVVRNFEVEYCFVGNSNRICSTKVFKTSDSAIRFATRFAAIMRKCDERGSVPTVNTFDNFS